MIGIVKISDTQNFCFKLPMHHMSTMIHGIVIHIHIHHIVIHLLTPPGIQLHATWSGAVCNLSLRTF